MLYHLFYSLRDLFFPFNVFRYITFRVAACGITAFVLTLLFGPPIIRLLRRISMKEELLRHDAPTLYQFSKDKVGTPTMGGIIFLLSIALSTFLWADLANRYIWLVLVGFIWLGIIGFLDDYIKIRYKNSKGLRSSTKLAGQIIAALAIGFFVIHDPYIPTTLEVPFFKKFVIELGVFYIPFIILVIVGSSNAVNITDGLDGLAIGCTIVAALTYMAFSYITGHVKLSGYLQVFYAPGAGELSIFCAALTGAALGFLWFNAHPAEVFMGDTGSLSLGGAIGIVAILVKKELLLLLVGGIFVVEALSVIIQVASYKARRKRVFLMAPLHHHFQFKGVPESKLIIRFWIVAIILAILSLATLKLR